MNATFRCLLYALTRKDRSTELLLTGAMLVAALLFVATPAFSQGITLDLGKTTTGRYLTLVGNTAGSDGEVTDMLYLTSEYAARNKGGAMCFALDDGFFFQLPATERALVNVEYYDAPAGVQITLIYDAQTAHAGKVHAETITTTGSNSWKAKTFTLQDPYFGNGLAHGADFKLVATAGAMTINAVSVVPFEAYYDYGNAPDSLNMAVREYMGLDSQTEIVVKQGEECITALADLRDQYLYIDVADSFIVSGNHPNVFVSVEYYDSDSTLSMRLQYEALGSSGSNRYKTTPYLFNKGWNSFRTRTFELSDAKFDNGENGLSDFRLQIVKGGLAVNRILVARLPKKPLPATDIIPNLTAYKAIEPPTLDGTLSEWGWLTPVAILPQLAADGSRTDEFYRTWLLNPANVPVAEPGEPGVTDPLTPGMWDVNDLSGGVRALWDDQSLYFSVTVKDNVVSTANAAWSGQDGFGFFIDVAHTYSASNAPVPVKDNATFQQGEHFFFFPAEQAKAGTWRHSTSQEGEALPAGVTRTVVKTDSGYTIEASVPLSVIADGLTWHPGAAGDKDAFNPLFAWLVNDNDGLSGSSGRVMSGGNSEDDEFWGTLTMAQIPQVDRGLMIDLGVKNYESFVKQVEMQPGSDGMTTAAVRGGKTGVMLSSGYLYLDVNDTVFNRVKHPHLLVSVEYFDSASTGAGFRLQYDADTSAYASLPYFSVGSSKAWRTQLFEIADARFAGRQNGHADFRIASSSRDVVINQVKVAMADLWIDLGDSVMSKGIRETQLGGDGQTNPITVGGVNCKRNEMGYGNFARYFYFGVADSLIYNGNHKELFVTVEYYDTTSSGGIGLMYNSMSSAFSRGIGDAFITGSRGWKLHTFYLPDARFANMISGKTDFRIEGKGDGTSFVNRVLIGSLSGTATGLPVREKTPLTFRLEQNYPNPFNPATTIRYTLPHRSYVTLTIFNMLGQKIAEPVNADVDAGLHNLEFDAGTLPSGVYFYRLQTGGVALTRAMVVVK